MALLCCCLGLRISECLALKWSDVDWINGKLTVERGIICQQVDDVKTAESRKKLGINRELLESLKPCKQATQFPVGVQQKLMRHSNIRTTMNVYGDAGTAEMAEAHGRVVRLALPQF